MQKVRTMLKQGEKDQRGISLVEAIIVVAAVGFIALLITSLPSSIASINKSRHTSIAKDIANREIDYLRKQTYSTLSSWAKGSTAFSDSNLAALPQSTASFDIQDCPASVCSFGAQVLQVKVEVGWMESGVAKTVELVTLVGNGGVGQ